MPTNLMVYADVVFQTTKIAPREVQEVNRFRWNEAAILRGKSSLHFTGSDSKRIRISGTVYPALGGREPLDAIEALKAIGELGKPSLLMDYRGTSLGLYALLEIEETRKRLDKHGIPQIIDFTLSLLKYENL